MHRLSSANLLGHTSDPLARHRPAWSAKQAETGEQERLVLAVWSAAVQLVWTNCHLRFPSGLSTTPSSASSRSNSVSFWLRTPTTPRTCD